MATSSGVSWLISAFAMCAVLFACDEHDGELVVVCVDPGGDIPAEAWVCGEAHVVECASPNGTVVHRIYAELETGTCGATTLTVSDPGPFPLGDTEITVSAETDDSARAPLCTSTLSVVDTKAPTLRTKTTELWPPNHQHRTITTSDCVDVVDACDDDVQVTFTYATSDEPRNDTGDGNTDVDIEFVGCDAVNVIAERKGNGDARVYTLGLRAVDASGNVAEGECRVIVPHDQGAKVPVEGAPAYRQDAPACD